MNTELVSNNLTHATETGLALSSDLPYEEWEQIGPRIVRTGEMAPFLLGDWINFGESRYGEKYTQAVTLLEGRYKPGTLVNLASVARRIPAERRRPNLSYRHHQTVAYLEPEHADKFLAECERTGMKSDELRAILREVKILPEPATRKIIIEVKNDAFAAWEFLLAHRDKDPQELFGDWLMVEAAGREKEGTK